MMMMMMKMMMMIVLGVQRGGEHWVGGPANFTKQAVVVVVAAKSDYYKWVFVINGAEAG